MIELTYLIVFVFLVFILCEIVILKDNGLHKSFLVGFCIGVIMGVLQWLTTK